MDVTDAAPGPESDAGPGIILCDPRLRSARSSCPASGARVATLQRPMLRWPLQAVPHRVRRVPGPLRIPRRARAMRQGAARPAARPLFMSAYDEMPPAAQATAGIRAGIGTCADPAARTASTTSSGNRIRCSTGPPYPTTSALARRGATPRSERCSRTLPRVGRERRDECGEPASVRAMEVGPVASGGRAERAHASGGVEETAQVDPGRSCRWMYRP